MNNLDWFEMTCGCVVRIDKIIKPYIKEKRGYYKTCPDHIGASKKSRITFCEICGKIIIGSKFGVLKYCEKHADRSEYHRKKSLKYYYSMSPGEKKARNLALKRNKPLTGKTKINPGCGHFWENICGKICLENLFRCNILISAIRRG